MSKNKADARRDEGKEGIEDDERERRRRKNAETYSKRAVKYGEEGRYLEALEAFKRSISFDPDNADVHFGLGLTYFNLGRWDNAAAAFAHAARIEPGDLEAVNFLGASYLQLGAYGKAVEAFQRVLELDPKRVDARYNIANALFNSRQYRAAIDYYEGVTSAKPKLADAHNDLGVALSEVGRPQGAVESFKRAIQFNPRDPYPHNNLAVLFARQGKHDEAVEALARAQRLDPDDEVIGRNATFVGVLAASGKVAVGETVATSSALTRAGKQESGQAEPTTARLNWLVRSNVIRDQDLKELSRVDHREPASDSLRNTTSPPLTDDPPEPLSPGTTDKISPSTSMGQPTGIKASTSPTEAAAPASPVGTVSPTEVYRVGAGDVLDIRLLNTPSAASTLYTVTTGGFLDYPPAGEPMAVAGLTTGEIESQLKGALLGRAGATGDEPQLTVGVREFSSHTVQVSGLVHAPGPKILRREAVPLYVIVADAQPQPEAGRAVVRSRSTGKSAEVALTDLSAMGMLIYPGDVVEVSAPLPQFYFVSGKVKLPGQRELHPGLTLTQAVVAAGGELHSGKATVIVTRQGAGEQMTVLTYRIRDITSGKAPDPVLQSGDRLEVLR